MSVHPRNGKWQVKWREENGAARSRTFDRKRDAERWDAEVRRLRQLGELAALEADRTTVAEFAAEWWRRYAVPNLAPGTRKVYATVWDCHVGPRIGGVPLRRFDVFAAQGLMAELEAAGVGRAARRKAHTVLSSVLARAAEWGRIPANPMRSVKAPSGKRERAVRPLSPTHVEAMRRARLAAGDHRSATLISVLAYVGPRPDEALRLRWHDIGEHAVTFHATKTEGRRIRAARLLAPVRGDLMEWRMASGRPPDAALVFPRPDDGEWAEHDYRNWRCRVFVPTARECGLDVTRPYDLRHSAASLWIHEGRSAVEVAAWLGNSPAVTWDTYLHVFPEAVEHRDPEAAIRAARGEPVPLEFPDAAGGDAGG